MTRGKQAFFLITGIFLLIPVLVFASPIDSDQVARDQAGWQAAFKQYQPLADKGNAEAEFNIALLYASLQEYPQAIKWYLKAADQGNLSAQNFLGDIYFEGKGMKQDYVQAYRWFSIAAKAAQGNEDYAAARDAVAKKMTPQQLTEGKRLANEWKP